MSERGTVAFVILAIALVTVAALAPSLVGARPAREIPAPTVEEDLSGTDAPGWEDAPAVDIPMTAAPSGLPNADSVSVRSIHVQAARADGQMFLRLQWEDPTENRSSANPQTFADAVAVQMPVNGSAQPAIAMGSPSNMVNVWYWDASTGIEELFAGGQGSTTEFQDSTVETWTEHESSGEDGTWTVVFSRPLDAAGDNRTVVTDDRDLDVAFAVWDGGNDERSGQKATTQWYYLPFGPDAGGTPFGTVLWAIAGIAVAVVVLVTVQGVRRVRSEGGG